MATSTISENNSEALNESRVKSDELVNELDTKLVDIIAIMDVLGAAASNAEELSEQSLSRVSWKIQRETQHARDLFYSYREQCGIIENLITEAKEAGGGS